MATKQGLWWWRIQYGFFNQYELNYIRSLPRGNEKVLIFIEMITESIKYGGKMRFSENIPWSPELMAPIVHTQASLLQEAWNDFKKINLIIIEEDGTIYLPMVEKLTGFQTKEAEYMQRYRKKNKKNITNVKECNYKSKKNVRESKELIVKNKELINIYTPEFQKKSVEYVDDFKNIFKKYYSAIHKRFTTKVARQKIEDAMKKNYNIEDIKTGFENYLAINQGIDIQYIKNFGTFMNQEIWRDYITVEKIQQTHIVKKTKRTENKSNFDNQKINVEDANKLAKLFEELDDEK